MPIAPPTYNLTTAIAAIDSPSKWAPGSITYSVPKTGSTYPGYAPGSEPFNGEFGYLTDDQAVRFRAAIAQWDELITRSFVELTEPGTPGGIRVAYSNTGLAWGYAFLPTGAGASDGDIWIDGDNKPSSYAAGSYDFMAMMHEIGHAIGLEHPFEGTPVLPANLNNYRYSIMSYTEAPDGTVVTFTPGPGGGIQSSFNAVSAITPSIYDIAAVQSMYGADLSTRTGSTTYTFDPAAAVLRTIYDAGSADTWDLAGHTRPSHIDLRPGAISDVDFFSKQAQIDAAVAIFGAGFQGFISSQINQPTTFTWSGNVGIAYGTIIENVKLGDAADTLLGNDVNNVIAGNGGADILNGGAGLDTADFSEKTVAVVAFLNGAVDIAVTVGGVNEDIIRNFENLNGGSANDSLVGDGFGNILTGHGGADFLFSHSFNPDGTMKMIAGNDTLNGGAGDDGIFAGDGNDTLNGGDGADGMVGGGGIDMLNGGVDGDFLFGGGFTTGGAFAPNSGNDTLNGGDGNDGLWGQDGADTINGDGGDDYVEGGEGIDTINGGAGGDTILGQGGNDVINGGAGFDYLYGGLGGDTLAFNVDDSYDTWWDFVKAEGDRLRLDADLGVTTFAQFQARITGFVFEGVNYTVLNFAALGHNDQITIKGVATTDWAAGMVAFA